MRGEADPYTGRDALQLKARTALCTGCDLCLVACVAAHDSGDYGAYLARLRIEAGARPGQHKVMFCTLCKKCIEVCPTQALRWHPHSGAVELLPELCEACGKCVQICPTQVILHSEEGLVFADGHKLWYPMICDLCAGAPECARICPTGAIFTAERRAFQPVSAVEIG